MTPPVLNRRLLLEAPVRVPDGAGGFVQSWVVLGVLWGAVNAQTGREAAGQGAALSRLTLRIILRAAPKGAPSRPEAGQRLRDGSRIYALSAVAEADTAARYLICHATEEAAT